MSISLLHGGVETLWAINWREVVILIYGTGRDGIRLISTSSSVICLVFRVVRYVLIVSAEFLFSDVAGVNYCVAICEASSFKKRSVKSPAFLEKNMGNTFG